MQKKDPAFGALPKYRTRRSINIVLYAGLRFLVQKLDKLDQELHLLVCLDGLQTASATNDSNRLLDQLERGTTHGHLLLLLLT